MKIKTFGQRYQENNEKFDERINKFIESVEVLDIQLSSGTYGDPSELSDSSTVLVIYRDKTPFNDNLVSKKYWGTECKLWCLSVLQWIASGTLLLLLTKNQGKFLKSKGVMPLN